MAFIKKYNLPFVVFLTGACVLIIEVVAVRILSPYYGNTIFTVSSVISIVLVALSLGYYFGGRLADRRPSEKLFYSIILGSGLSVLLLYFFILFLLPHFGYWFSIISGPIVSSSVLFFLPSFLLGTLSPFAIKLQASRFLDKGIGGVTGEIFFWSTLGSLTGSLSAGFILIPRLGIRQIIFSIAIILTTVGLVPLIRSGADKRRIVKVVIFSGAMFLLGVPLMFLNGNAVYGRDGLYEKIMIYDGKFRGRPTRFFRQDRSCSGAMFLGSDELVYDYTKYYALYEIFKPDVKNALVLGGGAYSVPKALLKDLPEASVDVAEIEPSLFELAKKYFNVVETARLNNFVEDGRRFLYDADKKYDLIFGDVYYSLYSLPPHFTTKDFFEIVKNGLTDDGVFVANIIGDLSQRKASLLGAEIKTFLYAFPNSYFFAVDSPKKYGAQNIIFVGYNSAKKIDFDDLKIADSKNPIIRSLKEKRIDLDKLDFSASPLLTDDFSPVEYLTLKVFKKNF